jgi:hypothetical protein
MPVACPPVEALVARFRDRSATVGIIGLGYVGLPLVQALLDNGRHRSPRTASLI